MPVVNGVPEQQNSVWVGALNMEELAIATGLPAGFTGYGELGESLNATETEVIASAGMPNGLTQALALKCDNDAFGLGWDAFDGLIATGEIVTLALVETSGIDGIPFPAYSMSGETLATRQAKYVRARRGGGNTVNIQCINHTSAGSDQFVGSEFFSSVPYDTNWVWGRYRLDDVGGGSDHRYRAKVWDGEYEDEPAGWDIDVTTTGNYGFLLDAIGWYSERNGPIATERPLVAYIGFTGDPDTVATPGPNDVLNVGDVIPPLVTMEQIQGDWASARIPAPVVQT